jgi:hypothetical protein
MLNNEPTIGSKISRSFPQSFLMKVINGIQSLKLKVAGRRTSMKAYDAAAAKNVDHELVTPFSKEGNMGRHAAIISQMNAGKSFDEAELIVNTMEEWGLDLAMADSMEFKVVGNSVWIDHQD